MSQNIFLRNNIIGSQYLPMIQSKHFRDRSKERDISLDQIMEAFTNGFTTLGKFNPKYESTPYINTVTIKLKDGRSIERSVLYHYDENLYHVLLITCY